MLTIQASVYTYVKYSGKWEEAQLSRELKELVAKHRNVFEGAPINEADVETERD